MLLFLVLCSIQEERYIIHRDLSASNVMLGDENPDFGLAKQKQREFGDMQSVETPYW
jgi:tRNA A-37 threonylcarbamoyl transferase component Bud32